MRAGCDGLERDDAVVACECQTVSQQGRVDATWISGRRGSLKGFLFTRRTSARRVNYPTASSAIRGQKGSSLYSDSSKIYNFLLISFCDYSSAQIVFSSTTGVFIYSPAKQRGFDRKIAQAEQVSDSELSDGLQVNERFAIAN